jgi:hypothetical protein
MIRYLLVGALGVISFVAAAPAPKPVPFAEFTDPAGDVPEQNGPGNDRDVVKARIESDGTSILVSATLAQDEHGNKGGGVLELDLDTDNNAATGGTTFWGKDAKPPKRGYDYVAKLSVCMAYNENIGACAGGPDVPPKSRHARIVLQRFKGAAGEVIGGMNSADVISGFGPAGAPLTGRVLTGKIPYDKLGVKPGQVIRVTTCEYAVPGEAGYFPDTLLTLK